MFLCRHLGNDVKIRQAYMFHLGLRQSLQAFGHTVGEDAHNAQHLRPGFPEDIDHLQDAPPVEMRSSTTTTF